MTASASINGYLYQFDYALYRLLLNDPNAEVGIETEDDLSETHPGELGTQYIQSKYSDQSTGHPLTDSSRNLWHSLHVWLTLLDTDEESPHQFLFLTNRPVAQSALVRQLSDANSPPELKSAIQALRLAGPKVSAKAKPAANALLAASDAQLAQLVRKIRLIDDGKPDGVTDLRKATIALFQFPMEDEDEGDAIFASLRGLLIDQCQTFWKAKKPAILTKEKIVRRLRREIQRLTMHRRVERPQHALELQNYLGKDNRELRFLRQIEKLHVSERVWDTALHDYWGFYTERVRLRELGDLLEDDWAARNSELHRRWCDICDDHAHFAPSHHAPIFRATINAEYHGPLGADRSMHKYFTTGNYHALANGEDTKFPLSWHHLDEEDDS